MNAIVIGFAGRVKMCQMQAGGNPFAPPKPAASQHGAREIAHIPDPSKLPLLTPAAFDAMFPGRVYPESAKAKPKAKPPARRK